VDYATTPPPGDQPERDRVLVQWSCGERIFEQFRVPQRLNDTWIENSFQIPISWIKFPTDPGAGGTLTPADNAIRLDIDTANPVNEDWCTSIDWVSMNIPAPSPVLMVHGILSSGDTWNSQWVPGLTALGIPNETITLGGPGGIALDSIQNNSAKISNKVDERLNRFGVEKVNIVAHSKGGLDSREYIESNDTVGRLIQIGTPNAGQPVGQCPSGGSRRANRIARDGPDRHVPRTGGLSAHNRVHEQL